MKDLKEKAERFDSAKDKLDRAQAEFDKTQRELKEAERRQKQADESLRAAEKAEEAINTTCLPEWAVKFIQHEAYENGHHAGRIEVDNMIFDMIGEAEVYYKAEKEQNQP